MSRGKSEDGADAALWQKIISQTSPLDKRHKSRQIARAAKPSATKKRTAGHSEKPIRATASRLNQAAKPNAKPAPALQPEVTIEHKARRRLSRGHLEIEARLDLHGMTAAQAKAILDAIYLSQRWPWADLGAGDYRQRRRWSGDFAPRITALVRPAAAVAKHCLFRPCRPQPWRRWCVLYEIAQTTRLML